MIALKNEPNIALVDFRPVFLIQPMDGVIEEMIFARPGRIVHAQQMQQSGLPRPGRTHDGDELAFFDIDVDSPEYICLGGAVFEILFNIA